MKKILKGLVKYVAFTVLLACFLPLSLQHVQADEDEVEYSLPSYVGHLSIQDRKSTRLNSSHSGESRMPSSA